MAILGKKVFNVFNAYFYLEGKIAMVQENLTSSSISSTATENLIKNGIGNGTWASISSDKELNVELQTNVIDFNQIALACGTAIVKGAKTVHSDAKVYKIGASNKVTLDKEPLVTKEVQIVDVAKDEIVASEGYQISGSEVTFTTLTEGMEVKVLPYTYTSVAGTEEIVISAEKFAQAGKLVLKTIAIDNNQKPTDEVEIVIEQCKPSSDFTISTSSDTSNGNDNTISLKALKDSKNNLGYIRLIPIEQ